ncbi:MAG: DUF2254 domain-containing protein [Adhaeribacter sp.]
MGTLLTKWFRKQFNRIITSIAFLPAITALAFLFLSWLMLELDFSPMGKELKSQWQWLRLKDATTARSVIATIASGIISLTVFSFSMVMIVLNQAASQLSNRVLGKLIGNRFQQVVLGFYIGTIVYAFFLLSTIRDLDSGVYVPAMSVYLLILFTVLDIFLFIYFLHYITQSVKYETIVERIYRQTREALEKSCARKEGQGESPPEPMGAQVGMAASGIFQGIDSNYLLGLCEQEDIFLHFIFPTETFLLQGTPLLRVSDRTHVSKELKEKILNGIETSKSETIETNYFYGLRQLMEVAIKALSPGINDPGTAVISLHALADLLAFRACHFPETQLKDSTGKVRIVLLEKTYEEIFLACVLPIWDYGKEDRTIQHAMYQVLLQLEAHKPSPAQQQLLQTITKALENCSRSTNS